MDYEMFMLLFEVFWENEFKFWRDQGIASGVFPDRIKDDELRVLKPKARQIFEEFWNFIDNENIKIAEKRTMEGHCYGPISYLLARCSNSEGELAKYRRSYRSLQKKLKAKDK